MRIIAQHDGTLNDADFTELTRILAKAGYTVRRVKIQKSETAKTKIAAVDFWGDGEVISDGN